MNDYKKMVEEALSVALQYGGIDGAHHKDWVIDQMVRALTGCPMVEKTEEDCRGNDYTFLARVESEDYKAFVRAACNPDGTEEDEYTWSEGVPP